MDNLHFKDFSSANDENTLISMQSSSSEKNISGNLLDGSRNSQAEARATKPHFLTSAYYQRFFDIDESVVFSRILNSAFPRKTGNFITDFVQPNPDIWGPFWISTTLVFSIAIVGDFANFLKSYGDQHYSTDFSFVTGATSLIFGYVLLLPSLVYTFLWYHPASALQYSFFDLLCAYGYSMSLFIPASILCPLLPFNSIRWALIISSTFFTGAVLCISLWSTVKEHPNRLSAIGFILAIFAAHALLALCLKEFYFDVSGIPLSPHSIISTVAPPQPGPATNSSLSG